MASKPESRLRSRIVKAIRAAHPGSWIYVAHGGPLSRAGVPDIIGCAGGRMFAIEVKIPTRGRLSALQRLELSRLAGAGAVAGVATSVDEALDIVLRCL